MRFVWPAQRYDRLTRKAAALSVAITALVGVALSLPIVTIYRASGGDTSVRAAESPEVVSFVQTEARVRPIISRIREEVVTPRDARHGARSANSDTGSAAPVRAEEPGNAASPRPASPDDAAPRAQDIGPVARPVGILRPPVIGLPPPKWRPLPLTQAERDSIAREQERRIAEGHEQHRPVAVPMGGAGIPLPFLSRGPSREERARDSVIHADNLARLARLAERARAKRDSLNAVKALAGPVKLDTTRPRERRR